MPLALAVGYAMIASYVLSSTFVPVMSVWLLRGHDEAARRHAPILDRLRSGYEGLLTRLLPFRVVLVTLYLAGSAAVIAGLGTQLGLDIFPRVGADQFRVRFRAPDGTHLGRSEQIALRVIDTVKQEVGPENVHLTLAYVGTNPSSYPINAVFHWSRGPEETVLWVDLKDGADIDVAAAQERLREQLAADPQLAGVRFSFEPSDIINEVMSFGSPTPVEVAVSGPDFAASRAYAEKLYAELNKVSALRDLQFAQSLDYPTIEVNVDRERAGLAGVTPIDVSNSLYAKIEGYVHKTRTLTADDGQPVQAPIADIGDRVHENDVLAEISVPEMEQELRQKQALYAQAKAEVEQAAQATIVVQKAAESAAARIREAEAGVARADGEYQRWEAERTRIQQLAASGSVSQKLADETLNQFRAADAGRQEVAAKVESAKAALGEAEATVAKAKADEAAAAARLEVAQANVDHMQSLLGYAKILAPFAGIVTERNVDTGHFVRPPQGSGSPSLFVVITADVVRIVAEIPELEAPLVNVGNRAFIRVQSLGGEEIEGQVTRTAWALDPASRTLRAEIDLPNPTGRLRPGMYATVRIMLEDVAPETTDE
ncbi:MAG TPA: efflux RND transporter periplasmic adaptor subunit [Pirellulaceae bacterium]|nr:efflux RND transporter periplasmic adaptor subunit [Pirellulaceae bacterium]